MLTLALTAAALLAVDPCTLLTKSEAATVTVKAPTTALPYGPETDPETKARVSWCVMSGAPIGIIVYIDEFRTPADTAKSTTQPRLAELMFATIKVEPETGLGDRAVWAYSEDAARMVVVRGATVLSIVIGGVDLTKPAEKRGPARALAVKALARLK